MCVREALRSPDVAHIIFLFRKPQVAREATKNDFSKCVFAKEIRNIENRP